jgi:lysophospholipase L1-like esterase
MWLRTLRTAAAFVFLPMVACVVRLNERNEPLPNGGVTGPDADCNTVTPPGFGGPASGPARTKFVGRYGLKDATKAEGPTNPRTHFDWSGNYMSTRFQGTEVTWGVEAGIETIFEMIVDDQPGQQVILGGLAPASRTVTLPSGEHEITVIRSSEALFGDVVFVPFTFGNGTTQLPPTEHPRKIEFIGDSILCGYGNEGPNATCPYDVPIRSVIDDEGKEDFVKIPETQNINLAYGSLTARRFQADAVTLCFSGKGVVLNYREQGVGEGKILNPNDKPDPDAKTTIPDYYKRTLATETNGQLWPFMEPPDQQPQVVVINVGTNDFARDVNQDSIADGINLQNFKNGYRTFFDFVRSNRREAHIFLAVPPMVTDKFPLDDARKNFRNTLRGLVEELNRSGDTKVYFIELLEMGVRYGLGCDYHPNLKVHELMADQVVGAIKKKTCWNEKE